MTDRRTGDEDLAAIRKLVADLPVERVVQLDLTPEKEFIYFDRNLKTGKWRVSFTKRTLPP